MSHKYLLDSLFLLYRHIHRLRLSHLWVREVHPVRFHPEDPLALAVQVFQENHAALLYRYNCICRCPCKSVMHNERTHDQTNENKIKRSTDIFVVRLNIRSNAHYIDR